ncbi:HlyD family secretion protein [Frateuria aurantia]
MSKPQIFAEYSRRSAVLVVLVLLVAAILVAGGLYLALRQPPLQLQGMVDTRPINIATKLPSRVQRLLVHEGDAVRAGQVLAILSSPELDARTEQAASALSGAEAAQARTDVGPRSEDLASLRAAWQASVASYELARQTAGRQDQLYAEGVIPAQRHDEAVAAREVAYQHMQLARTQYQRGLAGGRSEDRQMAQAQVHIAQAGLQEADALQGETRLVAPVAGEIDQSFSNPGEVVISAMPVFTLLDLHDLWVVLNVPEQVFHGLQLGHRFVGRIPALDNLKVEFRVSYIRPQGDFAIWRATRQSSGYDVRSFEIHLTPVQPVQGLRPGMSVLFDWPRS